MSKIITISNSKGGVGKSTLTLNLYNYLFSQGVNVAVCDTDLQASIKTLGKDHIVLVDPDKVKSSAFDFVFVDTPPYRSGSSESLLPISDFVLIPVKPSLLDVRASVSIAADCKKHDVPFALVLNMVKAGTNFTEEIRKGIRGLDLPLFRTEIHDRVDYARSLVFDSIFDADNGKAQSEIKDLTVELLTNLSK